MKKSEVKNNRKRRKIFLAFIMILFTGIILTASTYAWFTANHTVKVESIDVNVTATNGLQISTDATNWKAVVTKDDITGASWSGVKNQVPSTNLNPVSSAGTIDSTTGYMDMYLGTISTNTTTGANQLTATKETDTNGQTGNYVAFDLFFQINEAKQIYLTEASKVTSSDGGEDTKIQNAARVAFVVEGNVAYDATAQAAQALKGGTSAWIWEPNYDVHKSSGIQNALNTYGITTSAAGAAKIPYNGVNAVINTGVPVNSSDTNYFKSVTTNESPEAGITTRMKPFSLSAGVTKVRIYMWVEGQDVDCEDNASGGTVSYNLSFSIDETGN
jgi:hypothetical protein